jgi:hypothetical protein
MVPEKLPAVIQYGIPTSKRIFRIFSLAVVWGGGGYVIYSIFDFSVQNMSITLVIIAAMVGYAYSELSSITAKLRLESDAFIFSTLFVKKRILYSTVKGFVPYVSFSGLSGWRGIQLVPEEGNKISIDDQFNDYVILKSWTDSHFVNLKTTTK